MEVKFEIQSNFEKDRRYYIETDFGELSTTDKQDYDKTIKDGYIVLILDNWDYTY